MRGGGRREKGKKGLEEEEGIKGLEEEGEEGRGENSNG